MSVGSHLRDMKQCFWAVEREKCIRPISAVNYKFIGCKQTMVYALYNTHTLYFPSTTPTVLYRPVYSDTLNNTLLYIPHSIHSFTADCKLTKIQPLKA